MYKKILIWLLCIAFVFAFGVQAYAEETVQNSEQQTQAESWQNIPNGNRGGFSGQRPNRENMQMPEGSEGFQGEMPSFEGGEFTAPEGSGDFSFQKPSQDFGNSTQNGQLDFGSSVTGEESLSDAFLIGDFIKEYQTPIISMALLLLAFVFVKLYKRKNY